MACVEINQENFKSTVLECDKPVMFVFWATWCGHCQALVPVLEELSEELNGKAVFAKANIDENDDLADEYDIVSVPTIFVMKDGKQKEKVIGSKLRSVLKEMVLKHA